MNLELFEQHDDFDFINSIDRTRFDLSDPFVLTAILEFLSGQPLAPPERMTDQEQRNLRAFAFGYYH